ncbi:MAG: hypothetical protein HZB76_04830 [Chlamydiae bacterium]|nr:hypothetical protein [Chlamydiota bacterium]
MSKKDKLTDRIKEGVSVEEIENIARKYTTEGFLVIALIIATISSTFGFFTTAGWSLSFAGIGAVVGFALPEKIEAMEKKLLQFVFKQNKTTEIIIGIARVVVAIFIPFLQFAEIGLLAGVSLKLAMKALGIKKDEENPS